MNTSTVLELANSAGFSYSLLLLGPPDHLVGSGGEKAVFQVNGVPPEVARRCAPRTMSHNVAWTGLVYVDPHGGGD